MLYDVPSSSTVVSRNYNTMAIINKQQILDLLNEIPGYKSQLMRTIYSYNDPMKENTKKIITRIPYFGPNYLNKHLFHLILYNFRLKFYPSDELILKEGVDESDRIIVLVSGKLEIYSDFEGNEFIIEVLKPGSILNHRMIFTEDTMQVNVRTLGNT
jgi:CRP-like cAMP-binding protein